MLWDDPQRNVAPALDTSGRDLPTTFGETFSAAWSRNTLFSQDYFGENDRMAALDDYLGKIKSMTGSETIRPDSYTDPINGNALTAQDLLRQTNDKLNEYKKQNPGLELDPMSADELSQNAVAKRRAADADFEATMDRPRGAGATAGRILGGLAASAADPINLAALPVAPEEGLGVLMSALRWGEISGAAAVVSTALGAPYQEQVQPGYIASGQPLFDIGKQTAVGAIGGAAFPLVAPAVRAAARTVSKSVGENVWTGLANIWDRARSDAWPTSVKQAGDIVSSQANIIQSNIYPDADGAAAHEQALAKTTNDILNRRPVDVSKYITPELEARAAVPIEAARTQAQAATAEVERLRAVAAGPQPELPFAQTAAGARAQAAQQMLGTELQQIARGAGYDMPVEEAARISDKLTRATPEEAQTIVRELQMSPRQVAAAPARLEPPREPVPTPVAPVDDIHAPDFQTAVRADLDRELAAAPVAGGRDELAQMLVRGEPTEKLITHPEVKRALAENAARVPTGTMADFKNAKWRADRVYDFDGDKVQGWDAAVSRLTDQAREFAGGEVKNEGHAIILLGGPASGKSTIAETLAQKYGAAIVDADEAKKIIPEYAGGLGTSAVHEESSQLAKDVLKEIVRGSTNVLLPKVGQNVDTIRAIMAALTDRGYKVDLVHAAVPIEVAQRRNLERFVRTGRLVDPDYIKEVGEKPLETAHILSGDANETAYVDNLQNTVEGKGPLADAIRTRRDVGQRAAGGVAGAPPGRQQAEQRIPVAVDAEGNVTYQSIQKAVDEVDAYKTAAEQIAACAAPAAEAAA
jgi:predicted kinase